MGSVLLPQVHGQRARLCRACRAYGQQRWASENQTGIRRRLVRTSQKRNSRRGWGSLKKAGLLGNSPRPPRCFYTIPISSPKRQAITLMLQTPEYTVRLRTAHEHQREKETPEPLTSAKASGKGKIPSWERSVQDVTWAGQ